MCHARKTYDRGVGKVPNCAPGQDYDAGLCYRNCSKPDFYGVGPVCWQSCSGSTPVDCGAGCAASKKQCGSAVFDQVLGPIVVTANIATLGLSTPVSGALAGVGDTIKIGTTTVTRSTKLGSKFIDTIKFLQSVKPQGLAKDATLVRRIVVVRTGSTVKKALTSYKVYSQLTNIKKQFASAYADEFQSQTSPEINREIDSRFDPFTARYIKEQWGQIQLDEMASATDFQIAQDTLSGISLVDISGVTSLVNAYTKPICQDNSPFPTLSQTYR